MYVTLQSSICFEHQHAHLQEDKLYYQSICYRHSLYSTVQYAGWVIDTDISEEFSTSICRIVQTCVRDFQASLMRKINMEALLPLKLISLTNFNAQFLYSINSIYVTLQSSTCFEHQHAHLQEDSAESALIRHTVQPFTESDDTRHCDNTICHPEDGHVDARNMSRIVM